MNGHYVRDKSGASIWVGPAGEELAAVDRQTDAILGILEDACSEAEATP